MLATPEAVRLRVVGYADPLGSRAVNERLTLVRRYVLGDLSREDPLTPMSENAGRILVVDG